MSNSRVLNLFSVLKGIENQSPASIFAGKKSIEIPLLFVEKFKNQNDKNAVEQGNANKTLIKSRPNRNEVII